MLEVQAWREKLAGLTDPDYSPSNATEENATLLEFRKAAIDLVIVLCGCFNSKRLNRKTMWSRIESGMKSQVALPGSDGKTDEFISRMIEHVQGVWYISDPVYLSLLDFAISKPIGWRQGWLRYIERNVPAILGHGRLAWQKELERNKDAYAKEFGGMLSTGEIVVIGTPETDEDEPTLPGVTGEPKEVIE